MSAPEQTETDVFDEIEDVPEADEQTEVAL